MDPFRTPAAPTRPCPRCEIGLGTRTVLDASFDECSSCTGVFVPGDLLPRLLDPLDLGLEVVSTFDPGDPELETTVRYLKCPRCAALMNRNLMIKGSSVIVDRCRKHGVWFDAHELRKVAELASQRDVTLHPEPEPAWMLPKDEVARNQAAAALVRPGSPPRRAATLGTLFEYLLLGRRRG